MAQQFWLGDFPSDEESVALSVCLKRGVPVTNKLAASMVPRTSLPSSRQQLSRPQPQTQQSLESITALSTTTSISDAAQASWTLDLKAASDEQAHFDSVCDSFRQYATFARCSRVGWLQRVASLPESQLAVLPRSMIPGTKEATDREDSMRHAEIRNQFFLDTMLRHAGARNSQDIIAEARRLGAPLSDMTQMVRDNAMSKVSSVLKSLARDWSKEGAQERAMSYGPILQSVEKYFPIGMCKDPPRIAVPGAGLGRLALEIASRGYEVQGNEFSLYMLLASDFLLNGGCVPKRPFAISPWLLETRNVCGTFDPSRKVLIPDVDPAEMLLCRDDATTIDSVGDLTVDDDTSSYRRQPHQPEFSMAAGEFVSIYSNPNEHGMWNGVVCCFFLDTAPCVVDYIQTIYNMLQENGVLISLGPLHFHWSGPPMRPDDKTFEEYCDRYSHIDRRYLGSVDMTWEDVREILIRVGFVVAEERLDVPVRYTADSKSMMVTDYRCVHFVARKMRLG